MNEIKKDNYNLYLIPSTRFKTISIGLTFRTDDSPEDSIYRALLKEILLSGTGKYKKINEYNKACLELYNP